MAAGMQSTAQNTQQFSPSEQHWLSLGKPYPSIPLSVLFFQPLHSLPRSGLWAAGQVILLPPCILIPISFPRDHLSPPPVQSSGDQVPAACNQGELTNWPIKDWLFAVEILFWVKGPEQFREQRNTSSRCKPLCHFQDENAADKAWLHIVSLSKH